jgi:hypothetical protein
MNFKAFFAPEVGIRLTDDLNGFVCKVRHGLFRKQCTFVFDHNLDSLPELLKYSVRRNLSFHVAAPRPQQEDPQL